MEESSCYYSIFIAICLFSPEIRELKIPHQVNKNWHWTNIHKVMKHVKNLSSKIVNKHKIKRRNMVPDNGSLLPTSYVATF
ncbi:hypothetical protein CDAR_225771 [Caerostris darwini]|uniref:Uncharacterized protein n=1 Tax=Caerostris darwini TaxID=1538125 RepID=A0AAV4M3L4_9ARAC|nr:hypothetical protein CDAR_225771 [Caerostris darwini]